MISVKFVIDGQVTNLSYSLQVLPSKGDTFYFQSKGYLVDDISHYMTNYSSHEIRVILRQTKPR